MRKIAAALVALALCGAANATAYTLTWSGIDGRTGSPDFSSLALETGSGSFTLKDGATGAGGLADLESFDFSTSLDYSASSPILHYYEAFSETATYRLADLLTFDATKLLSGSGDLSFTTRDVATSLGGQTESFLAGPPIAFSNPSGTGLRPGGYLNVTEVQPSSSVPEPSSWVPMLLGMAVIGWIIRRRRSLAACAVQECGQPA